MKVLILIILAILVFNYVPFNAKWNLYLGSTRLMVPIGLIVWASIVLSMLSAFIKRQRGNQDMYERWFRGTISVYGISLLILNCGLFLIGFLSCYRWGYFNSYCWQGCWGYRLNCIDGMPYWVMANLALLFAHALSSLWFGWAGARMTVPTGSWLFGRFGARELYIPIQHQRNLALNILAIVPLLIGSIICKTNCWQVKARKHKWQEPLKRRRQ